MTNDLTPPADAPLPWRANDNLDRVEDANGNTLIDHGYLTGEERPYMDHLVAAANAAPALLAELAALRAQVARQQAVVDGFVALHDRKAEWSTRTFGPGNRYAGVVSHIRKELAEIEAEPTDLTEWCDVILLAMDGAMRSCGATGAQLLAEMQAKQAKNETRAWPDWRTLGPGETSEHIRALDAAGEVEPRLNHLVETGQLARPEDVGCVDCGDMQGFTAARHEYDHARGYDGANQLYVEPVCSHCHHNREEARRG